MRVFLCCILLFNFVTGFAQNSFSVIYKYDDRYFPITFNGEKRSLPAVKDKLVFSDSLSFWYRLSERKDQMKKSNVYGSNLIHHAILYNRNTNLWYNEVAWPKGAKEYIIADSAEKRDWIFGEDSKSILGFQCKPALCVDEKNDSTLVWFTPDIPKPFGPFTYFGLPGLVLEVYDQQRTRHLVAVKVEEGTFQVTMPKEGIIIS